MVAAKREKTAARPKRDYPNEWTLYPDYDEEDERQEQQLGEQQNDANTVTESPALPRQKLKGPGERTQEDRS